MRTCRSASLQEFQKVHSRGRGRPRRAWSDDIKEWTHLSTEEVLQLARDRAAWRSVVHHAANVRDSE